ncbi:MAG: hypothetical protein NC092_00125 [Butyrivibrio sp.]|nr:hypothetical protein [Muribaculum sp.]MCM1551080.1 hypothetical protein [Butyrivibrio sp.]
MKKSTTRVTIIIVILVVAVVGYYAYLANRSRSERAEEAMSVVQTILSRDLSRDYPPTPKEVIKYYNEIFIAYYNEECSEEDIEALGLKARELYDDELLAANEVGGYLINLQDEVKAGRKNERRITSPNVASSVNVELFKEDGYEFAKLQCDYTILESGQKYPTTQMYLLRKDADKRWKIYGWEDVKNLEPQS